MVFGIGDMRKTNSRGDGEHNRSRHSRREVVHRASTVGLATLTIPSLSTARKTTEPVNRGRDRDIYNENQIAESDHLTKIVETTTYIVTKSTRSDSVTYLKEYIAGEKKGQIDVASFDTAVIPEDRPLEGNLIPEKASTHSSDDCTDNDGGWRELIYRVDRINESLDSCNARGIDDDAYGNHKYRAGSVKLHTTIMAICEAELINIVQYLLEPLGIPHTDRAVSYAIGTIAAWSTRNVTIGAIDWDGDYLRTPYVGIRAARKFSADHGELATLGSVPGHLDL